MRIRREHDDRAWSAWHAAYLTAYAPAKPHRFPKLKKLLSRGAKGEGGGRQTPAEMLEAVKTWMRSAPPASAGSAAEAPDEPV